MNDRIPNAVLNMLKAARLAVEEDIHLHDGDDKCHYSDVRNGCNKGCCVYCIVRCDGQEECLLDILNDTIQSMTMGE